MNEPYHHLETIIKRRRTEKVLGSVDQPVQVPEEVEQRNRALVLEALRTAGWAPFHYPRGVDGIAEPWRAYFLSHRDCQRLAVELRDRFNVTSKEPSLLSGCGAMVLVTWLPESGEEERITPVVAARNEEHLAASSAMVQNLLLLLTALEMGNYWSSGGILRSAELFQRLGISAEEQLLGAIFIEYPDAPSPTSDRKPGAQRRNRGDQWLREVTV